MIQKRAVKAIFPGMSYADILEKITKLVTSMVANLILYRLRL